MPVPAAEMTEEQKQEQEKWDKKDQEISIEFEKYNKKI